MTPLSQNVASVFVAVIIMEIALQSVIAGSKG